MRREAERQPVCHSEAARTAQNGVIPLQLFNLESITTGKRLLIPAEEEEGKEKEEEEKAGVDGLTPPPPSSPRPPCGTSALRHSILKVTFTRETQLHFLRWAHRGHQMACLPATVGFRLSFLFFFFTLSHGRNC